MVGFEKYGGGLKSDKTRCMRYYPILNHCRNLNRLKLCSIIYCRVTNASEKLDAAYDCFPALEEISDIRQESIISEKSYIDDSYADISDIPDLEVIPEVSNLPSLLGLDYASRDCTRILRSRTRHSINESSYCHL